MRLNTLLTPTALLASAVTVHAQNETIFGNISGSNQNGVATYNGYSCSGAIYVGCDNNVANAFCCVGAPAEQNICNYPQPTSCSVGSSVPLTAAASATGGGSASAPASTAAQSTAAAAGGSASTSRGAATAASGSAASSASTSSHSGGAAAAVTGGFPINVGAGMLAVAGLFL